MDKHFHTELEISMRNTRLGGELTIPAGAKGIIIFSHGSGSSRFSPRNRLVAEYLQRFQFATLLFDLLTREEDLNFENRFNIDLLTNRLMEVTNWLGKQKDTGDLLPAYFGASTGAASALRAASYLSEIKAVVSRGGRPDLAGDRLPRVFAPTLLLVGSYDQDVLQLNEKALHELAGVKKLSIIDGATHLFEEPGTMDQVCAQAAKWFKTYLVER